MSAYKTRDEARDAGQAAQALMKNPKQWRVEVWDNLGWHFALKSGYIFVYETSKRGTYSCLISRKKGAGYGDALWTQPGANFADSPQEAVEKAVLHLKEVVDEEVTLLTSIRNELVNHYLKGG